MYAIRKKADYKYSHVTAYLKKIKERRKKSISKTLHAQFITCKSIQLYYKLIFPKVIKFWAGRYHQSITLLVNNIASFFLSNIPDQQLLVPSMLDINTTH